MSNHYKNLENFSKRSYFNLSFQTFRKSHILVVALCFLMSTFSVNAQLANVPVTGFNNDIVASGTGVTGSPNVGVSYPSIGVDGAGYCLTEASYVSGSSGTPTCGMPVSNSAASLLTAGLTYSLQGYGTGAVNNNNALTITSTLGTYVTNPFPSSAALTLTTPAKFTKLYALVESVINSSIPNTMDVTVTFSDATTQVFTGFNFANWFTGSVSTTAFYQFNRVNPNNGGYTNVCTSGSYTTQPNMFEATLNLSPANYNKTVTSITFTSTSLGVPGGTIADKVDYLHIMAVGGLNTCPFPTFQPSAPSLTAFSTSQIDGSFTAAVGSPTGYLVVRYPAGATETVPVDGSTYVALQTIGLNGTVVQASSSLTFNNTGLLANTAYDYYVYAYNSGATCGGPIYNTVGGFIGSMTTTACGGISGTKTIPGDYATLTAAISDITTNGLSGATVLELQAGYSSASETFPLTMPSSPCIGPVNSLTIRPATGAVGLSINSGNATGTINFNGSSFITIDGRPGGTGVTSELTLANTNAGTSYALNFSGDASGNTIKYCTITSRNTGAASGTIVLGAGTATGNDNNTFDNCTISDDGNGTTFPVNAIYSAGTSAAIDNSANSVTNSRIANYFSATVSSAGILLTNTGNSTWTISSNKFYQTATRLTTGTGATHTAISVLSGAGYTINSNTIGFADAAGTGRTNYIGNSVTLAGFPTSYTLTGTAVNTRFIGINCGFTAGGTVSNIQGNTIAGIALFTSSGANTLNGVLCGINVTSGAANIGTSAGNTIGATTGTASLYSACTTTGGTVVGIYATSANNVAIQNNTFGAIDASGTSATTNGGISAIDAAGAGSFTITNNTIGNATASNMRTGFIQNVAPNLGAGGATLTSTTGATSLMLGIRCTSTGNSNSYNSNTLRNWITSGTVTTLTGITSSGAMTGTSPSVVANNNFLGTAATGAGAWMTYTVATTGLITGISLTNTIATTHSIQTNDFRGIVYNVAGGAQTVNLITIAGATAAGNTATIASNTFTNLSINNTGTLL
ncbi:MAG: hypothetical protein IPP32_02210 [Bacteroidetes bacterium]|nr:hypothetical protein [Bacteroidota bacterium]